MQHRKPGRPSKGPRRPLQCKLPTTMVEALHAAAAERGVTLTDMVGEWAERVTGVPYQAQTDLVGDFFSDEHDETREALPRTA